MTEALKPCPFCGCADIRIVAHPGRGSYPDHVGETVYTIGCYGCGGSVPGRYRRELVVETWNRRPEVVEHQVEALRAALAQAFSAAKVETAEQRGRTIVEGIDSIAREHGGSAEFVAVEGDQLHYRLNLPASVAAQLMEQA